MNQNARFDPPLPATQERGEGRGEGLLGRFGNHPRRVGRHKTMVLNLAHDLHATGAAMQRVPDFQQHTFPVVPPLPIPETQFLNVLRGQKLFTDLVALPLLRQPMLKTIQFHRQPRRRTVKVQTVFSCRILAAEFETSKSARPQRAPKFFLLVRLAAAKTAGVGSGVHRCKDRKIAVAGKPLSTFARRSRKRPCCKTPSPPPTSRLINSCMNSTTSHPKKSPSSKARRKSTHPVAALCERRSSRGPRCISFTRATSIFTKA